MKEVCLAELGLGERAEIVGYFDGVSDGIKRRVLELGFTVGVNVAVEHKSMLGDVLLLSVRGYLISLAIQVAKIIKVRVKA